MKLEDILERYGSPDPSLLSQLPKKNKDGSTTFLSYIGHADITKILIEIDPMWSWEPVEWFEGRPRIHEHEAVFTFRDGQEKRTRIAVMWGYLTVLGKRVACVGSCSADKEDQDKELYGDALRNGAMRLGIGIDLWAKSPTKPIDRSRQEHPANSRPRPQSAPAPFEDDYVPPGDPAPVIPMKKVAAGAKAKPATNLTVATAPQVSTIKNLLEQTQMGLLDATHAALGQEQATVENLSKGDASTLIKYLIEQKESQ